MRIFGIDLSGPASPDKTAVATFTATADELRFNDLTIPATDADILSMLPDTEAVLGLDAPLSYAPSGGSRASDTDLRARAAEAGLHAGSVMAPTAPRMAYLTLRGVMLARMMESANPDHRIVEIHPTAALALRGAPIDAVRTFKTVAEARRVLWNWFASAGITHLPSDVPDSDHAIAAVAGGLAAWAWAHEASVWCSPAQPPHHPFDFAC